MADKIAELFIDESKARLNKSRELFNHCLGQLSDEDLWWTPSEGCNCIGIIIQHLIGNLRQWIISGVGGEPDLRDRPREFIVEEKLSNAAMRQKLNDILDQVIETFDNFDYSQLPSVRTIQNSEPSILSAIYGTMMHLEHHIGQIVYLTKLKLGNSYKLHSIYTK